MMQADTYLSLPKMTIPTLSVSKLRAIPLTPDLNSTISPACTLVRPKTLAIPSPMEITEPNSLRSFYAIEGSKVNDEKLGMVLSMAQRRAF